MRRAACLLSICCSLLIAGHFTLADAADLTGRKPNIVFVITDDQGYGDISAHGNPVLQTPNLDRLHAEGVRFTDFHVSPTCSPTRSSLMSGRHEFRNGVTHTILERERMSLGTVTLPQTLKAAGYATGIFGKWHLGDEAEYQPNRRGFDEVFIHGGGGIGQSYPGSCGDAPGNKYFDPAILHNGKFEKTKGYCTDVFFAEAMKWIEAQAKVTRAAGQGRTQPFFCYIATNAPHGPLDCPPDYEARYSSKVDSRDVAKFFGMVANIDDNLGKLLQKLADLGIERDTLVIFMNDNGGTAGTKVFNDGMHGQKGTPYRGGTRAASFWRWPGTLSPADCRRLAAHIDVYPTLAQLAGAPLSAAAQAQIEGRSLVPLLAEPQAEWPDRILFTHTGRWPKGSDANLAKYANCSIRNPRWNLVSPGKPGPRGNPNPAVVSKRTTPNWELYDLSADPGETKNLAAEHPEVIAELSKAYDKWWAEVVPATLENEKAAGPAINPFHEIYYRQFGKPTSAKGKSDEVVAQASAKEDAAGPPKAAAKPKPARPAVRRKPSPSLQPIVDDPKLPRVLLIGDSISMGYTLEVRDFLKGKANVHRIPTNGGPTINGLMHLKTWLGDGKWDVIHFNWGLHDLKYMPDGHLQVAPEAYEKNLRELVAQMKEVAPGAKLIWCSTTPYPEGLTDPKRVVSDVTKYNALAKKVMDEAGVEINDLYGFVLPRMAELQIPVNVHFHELGSAVMATKVGAEIEKRLPKK
ncbi:MAG: hypothetical protein C0483_03040 [Pirellula sp.]|nr:hypothetical protein [Pirellula sp.]